MKLSLIILFFLLNVTIESLAADCGYVNVSKHFGKTYDQQDIGWCYAFSGSDLLTYKYRNVLNGRAVSPIHMALLQNLNDAEKISAEAGTVRGAIRLATYPFREDEASAFFKGVCLASVDTSLIDTRATLGLKKQFSQLGQLKTEYDLAISKNNQQLFIDFYSKVFLVNPLIAKLDVVSLQKLLRDSKKSEMGIKYLDLFCPYNTRLRLADSEYPTHIYVGGETSYVPPKGRAVYTKITDPKQILERVHQQLDKENVASISYYPEFMQAGYDGSTGGGTLHASTIVGREKLGNSCHIIIRNSWGDCKNRKGEYQYSKNVTKCVDGYLWVSEDRLTKHLDGITFLKN